MATRNDWSRRSFLKAGMAGLASTAFGIAGPRPAFGQERPKNVVLFLCDDMGAQELGCYGHPTHRTPNLDALAGGGVRFETFYATPVCSPTRVCLMTGRYGFRTGWVNMNGRVSAEPPRDADLALDEENFGEIMRNHGYATGFTGKWQLTGSDNLPMMMKEAGFDESLIWIYTGYVPAGEDYRGGYDPPGTTKSSRFWHPGVARNGKHIATAPEDYGPDMFADFCTDFIGDHKDEPFFLYYPMALIHRPWNPTPDTPDLTGRNDTVHLKANVEYCDKVVGRIVDTLEEEGLREDTLVIFIGDNGTQTYGKGTCTEYGARVPGIFNCPGTVQRGLVTRGLSDISDILPTVADFTGKPLPADITIDGTSLMPLLTGASDRHRDWIFSFLGHYRCLRDDRWLLEQNTPDFRGQFFDCGDHRDGHGYVDVTDSTDAEVLEARARFDAILENLPFIETTRIERRYFSVFTDRHVNVLNRWLADFDDVPQRVLLEPDESWDDWKPRQRELSRNRGGGDE